MRKKNLLFPIIAYSGWIGGIYYMRNIIYTALRNSEICEQYAITILVMEENASIFDDFKSEVKLIVVSSKNRWKTGLMRFYQFMLADLIYNHKHEAKDIFHVFDKKAIYWIADLQEMHYPQFFTPDEIAARMAWNTEVANSNRPLIVSSEACKQDFIQHFPQKDEKTIRVVHFVSAIEEEVQTILDNGIDPILEKYDLTKPYVLIANQFWQHKNHLVVFRMMALAKQRNTLQNLKFVFTGHLKDYRNLEYFELLKSLIEENKLDDQIKILGFIPREDQLAIMAGAQFLIQPSLFEGWGTVVEDGKVLDKSILLSDIIVHREQMNDKCVLFDPNSETELLSKAEALLNKSVHDKIEHGIANLHLDAERYGSQLKKALQK